MEAGTDLRGRCYFGRQGVTAGWREFTISGKMKGRCHLPWKKSPLGCFRAALAKVSHTAVSAPSVTDLKLSFIYTKTTEQDDVMHKVKILSSMCFMKEPSLLLQLIITIYASFL